MILGKIGFRAKKITRDRDEHYIRLEGSKKTKTKTKNTQQTKTANPKCVCTKQQSCKYQNLTEPKGETEKPLSKLNTSTSLSQKVVEISKGTEELSITDQQELSNTGINTTQHLITAENTSFQMLMEVVKEKQYLEPNSTN